MKKFVESAMRLNPVNLRQFELTILSFSRENSFKSARFLWNCELGPFLFCSPIKEPALDLAC